MYALRPRWAKAAALGWAAAFTLVGYGFSESFGSAGDEATRIALAAALVIVAVTVVLAIRSDRARRADSAEPHRDQSRHGAERRADEPTGEDVEREVHAQVDARERDGRGEAEHVRAHSRGEDRDRGRGGERRRRVARRERGIRRKGDKRDEAGVVLRRPRALEQLLERRNDEPGAHGRRSGGEEGERRTPAPQIAAESEREEQRPLHPPRGEDDEQRGEHRMLERGGELDQLAIELDQRGRHSEHATTVPPLLLAVNARASGVEDPRRTAAELIAMLEELGARAEAVVTTGEDGLFEALRGGVATGRRVVLVGGDGSLHGAANAALGRLPELAILPAGRANNIARALHIPTDRAGALAVAARAPARSLDVLRVETPRRTVYALEALSAGFQADARSGYAGNNSADLRQGVSALAAAVRSFAPYRVHARLDGAGLSSVSAAQLFLSNLPYFGFGFEVDPGADPADGRLEAILIEARGRVRLLRLLAAAYRGRHIDRPGVTRISGRRVELTEPLPLVADAVPLGTTTATVSVEPARLRVASPDPGAAR